MSNSNYNADLENVFNNMEQRTVNSIVKSFTGTIEKFVTKKMVERKSRQYDPAHQYTETGRVIKVSDSIIESNGLHYVGSNEVVKFLKTEETGIVMNLETNKVKIAVLGSGNKIRPGSQVQRTKRLPGLVVNHRFLGRIINSLGAYIDGKGDKGLVITKYKLSKYRKFELRAPSIIIRQKVTEPVYTGIMVIDSIIPIGRGQRELIIGDRQTGKTAIALDAVAAQSVLTSAEGYNQFSGLFCIYVSVGQRRSSVTLIAQKLAELDAMFYTTIVAATASEPVALQFLAPYAGCAIGEFYRDSGRHALIVYDDLSKHAVAYRQISLLLRRPPSREAYPGDIFYVHSRLLERAAKLSLELAGGGSLTALPIIETQAGDVSAYIPTNIISITDGQIFLESGLFYKGFRPAVNIGISVSRIGAAAQSKCMRQVAGKLKLELAQFREIEVFASFGSDIDEYTYYLLQRGQRLMELLKQDSFTPLSVYEQIILLYAGTNGYLDDLALTEVAEYKQRVLTNLYYYPELTTYDVDGVLPEEDIQEFLQMLEEKLDLEA